MKAFIFFSSILLLSSCSTRYVDYDAYEDLEYQVQLLEEQVEELENEKSDLEDKISEYEDKFDNIQSYALDGMSQASWAKVESYYERTDALETIESLFSFIVSETYY